MNKQPLNCPIPFSFFESKAENQKNANATPISSSSFRLQPFWLFAEFVCKIHTPESSHELIAIEISLLRACNYFLIFFFIHSICLEWICGAMTNDKCPIGMRSGHSQFAIILFCIEISNIREWIFMRGFLHSYIHENSKYCNSIESHAKSAKKEINIAAAIYFSNEEKKNESTLLLLLFCHARAPARKSYDIQNTCKLHAMSI